MINIKTQWGIIEKDNCAQNTCALQNSCAFLSNFEDLNGPAELYLPVGTYEFNTIFFTDKDDIEFYGDTNANGEPTTIIKFKALDGGEGMWCEDQGSNKEWHRGHVYLEIRNADNFNIHNLAFDGKNGGFHEGGVQAHNGSINGTLKNLTVYDAANVSLVVGGTSKTNPAHHVDVEDCTVYGQREWSGRSKAMILAGGYGYNITFKNCGTYSVSPYNSDYYSPADHYDTDNATNVEYHNCTADGTGYDEEEDGRQGVGFWNEAGGSTPVSDDHVTSSTYYGCIAIKTAGGLGVAENSSVKAYNFYFDECSAFGWTAWSRSDQSTLEIYNSTFDKCYSQGDPAEGHSPYLEGGVHFENGDGVVEDCTFINTPDIPNEDEFNVSFFTGAEGSFVTVTLENNTFDRGAKSHGVSEGSGDIYIINNDLGPNASFVKHGDYNWISSSSKESATTTAINTPTSPNTIGVEYEYHTTSVQYYGGESLDGVLLRMRKAVNIDAGAYIRASINMNDNTITFTPRDANSSGNYVHIINVNISDWGNGSPFNPMSPRMS